MKKKYIALTSLILIGLGFCSAVGYYLAIRFTSNHRIRFAPLTPVPVITVPSENEIADMRQAERLMLAVVRPARTDTRPVNLAVLGFKTEKKVAKPVVTRRVDTRSDFYYNITFAFTSGRKRFCIIDGTFYGEGSRLPGNAHIETIESRQVLIKKGNRKRWVPLSEPMPKTG